MRAEYQRGIALISVLWITTLLAVIAASFTSSARTEGQLARNMVENAKAEALADGAVHRAVLGILEPEPERAWRTDGRAYRLDYGDGAVVVRIFDEDAKVDLNAAPPELLAGLFRLLGLEDEQAETLAERIVDFRDEDDEAEPSGAEDPDYEAAGRADGAIDRPLVSEVELLGVLGMSEALYRRLRPFVTVYSGAEGIDPTRASLDVLRAVPGMTPEIAEAIRAAGPDGDPFEAIDEDDPVRSRALLRPLARDHVPGAGRGAHRGRRRVRARGGDRAERPARATVHGARLAARHAALSAAQSAGRQRKGLGHGRTGAAASDPRSYRRCSHSSTKPMIGIRMSV